MSYLLSIPGPILGEIISYLPIRDLPVLHLVSHSFSSLVYTYYPLTLHDPPLLEVLSRYSRGIFTYTPTTCIYCSNRSIPGEICCDPCISKPQSKETALIGVRGSERYHVLRVKIDDYKVLFRRDKNGYMTISGIEMLSPTAQIFGSLGYRYEPFHYDSIEFPICNEMNIFNKDPLIVVRCGGNLYQDLRGKLLPCISHVECESEGEPIKAEVSLGGGLSLIVSEPAKFKGIILRFNSKGVINFESLSRLK